MTEVEVPEIYCGGPVKVLSGYRNVEDITKLTIPEGVEKWVSSGTNGVFKKLKYLVIPKSLTYYVTEENGKYTNEFTRLPALETLEFAEGTKTIKVHGFYDLPALKTVRFPDSLRSIQPEAFLKCSKLESVMLPDDVSLDSSEASFYKKTRFIVKEGSKTADYIHHGKWQWMYGRDRVDYLEPEEFDRRYAELWGMEYTPTAAAETGSAIGTGSAGIVILFSVAIVFVGACGFGFYRKKRVRNK